MTINTPQAILHLAPYLPPSDATMTSRAQGNGLIRSRQLSCLAEWEKVFGKNDGSDGYGDYEDWTEQACRLLAAIDAFGRENVWFIKGSRATTAKNIATGEEIAEGDTTRQFVRYGSQPSNLYYQPNQQGERKADAYAITKVFEKYANRNFVVCGFSLGGAEGIEIVDAVVNLHNSGVRRVILKNTKAKKGFWDITLPEDMNASTAYRTISDEVDWALVREEGRPSAFLLQEYSPMIYEYRLFVVNHRLTTGAGCIEENTPLNNAEPFDSWFRKDRKDYDAPLVQDEKLRDTFVEFAQKIVFDTEKYEPECSNYVVDVALNSDGVPLMIERNAMLNSGFFAANPLLITANLRAAAASLRG